MPGELNHIAEPNGPEEPSGRAGEFNQAPRHLANSLTEITFDVPGAGFLLLCGTEVTVAEDICPLGCTMPCPPGQRSH